MKQGKTLLINNMISLLLYGVFGVLGVLSIVIIMTVSGIFPSTFPIWLYKIYFHLLFLLATLIPFVLSFFCGKWCLKKVEKKLCFVSPLAFLLFSFCFDFFTSYFPDYQIANGSLKLLVGFLCGDAIWMKFLTSIYVDATSLSFESLSYESFFFLINIPISILNYFLLVLGNMSGRKGSKNGHPTVPVMKEE